MSDLRGVLSLNEVFSLQKESEWESTDNVWIFPDGGGPEFKFADGTVTPAPPATPLSKTKVLGNVTNAFCVSATEGIGRAIVADPNDSILAITSPEGVRVYQDDFDIYVEHGDTFGEYGNVGFGSTGYTFIPRPVGTAVSTWGFSVAIGEGKIAVGDRGVKVVNSDIYDTDPNTHPADTVGKVYVWDLDGSNQTIITPASNQAGGQFGHSVGIGSGKVVVGAPAFESSVSPGKYTGTREGAVFTFNLDGTGENRIEVPNSLVDNSSFSNDFRRQNLHFGYSLCVHRGQIFVGAPNATESSPTEYHQGRVIQYDINGTYKNVFTSFDSVYFSGDTDRYEDEEYFGMNVCARDDELTSTNSTFNLFVGAPYYNYTSSTRGAGMIYKFKIDANTGAFPPAIREEDSGGNVVWGSVAKDNIAWEGGYSFMRQGLHMAFNNKSRGIFNNADGYMEISTSVLSPLLDFTLNGNTYQQTYSGERYYANLASSSILRMPLDFSIDNPFMTTNYANILDNVEIPYDDGTNLFTGNKCAIDRDFMFYGTNSLTQGAGMFSEGQPNRFTGAETLINGLYKGLVIMKQFDIFNGRKVLKETIPIV